MAKFHGIIGYAIPEETKPGVWTDRIVERTYSGDIKRNTSGQATNSNSTNDDLTIDCQISIIADPYVLNHFHSIKYVELYGTKWKVKNVDPQYPRLVLTMGGLYRNGQ